MIVQKALIHAPFEIKLANFWIIKSKLGYILESLQDIRSCHLLILKIFSMNLQLGNQSESRILSPELSLVGQPQIHE